MHWTFKAEASTIDSTSVLIHFVNKMLRTHHIRANQQRALVALTDYTSSFVFSEAVGAFIYRAISRFAVYWLARTCRASVWGYYSAVVAIEIQAVYRAVLGEAGARSTSFRVGRPVSPKRTSTSDFWASDISLFIFSCG